MAKKFTLSQDIAQVDYYLSVATEFSKIAAEMLENNTYPDNITPANYNLVSHASNNKEGFTTFLRTKYVYYKYMAQGKSRDTLFLDSTIKDFETMEKYGKVFDVWDQIISDERTLLLLRYNQLGNRAFEKYYNDIAEFKELVSLLSATSYASDLENNFMGLHTEQMLKNADWKAIHFFSLECSAAFVALLFENVSDENTYLKIFMRFLAKRFKAYLVDHMKVLNDSDGHKRIEYSVASDETIIKASMEAKMEEVRLFESYSEGEGISGALLFAESKIPHFHVGSNNLDNDKRQSAEHLEKFKDLYGFNIKNFWAFPYYDEDNNLAGAFRLVNKDDTDENPVWSYDERATMLFIIRWFEKQWQGIYKKIHMLDENTFSNSTHEKYYNLLGLNWKNKKFFDYLLIHIKTIINKKIENHYINACFAVYPEDSVDIFVEDKNYPQYPMQPIFYVGNVMIPFVLDVASPQSVTLNTLNDISLLYKTIHPFTAFFLFSSAGNFYGTRQLVLKKDDVPCLNKIYDITKDNNAVIFFTQGEDKSLRIYMHNALVADYYLSESDGDWRFRLFSKYQSVLKDTNIKHNITKDICEMIFELSHKRIGALIVFQDEEYSVEEKDKHKKMDEDNYIGHKNKSVLLGWASMDGAVLCTTDGHVKYAGIVLPKSDKPLKPHINTLINKHQKGSRHATAAVYSESHPEACVIVVSQNKGISIFYKENVIIWDDLIRNDPDYPLIVSE